MHITQKLSFDIFTVGNLLNIFMEHDLLDILMIFGINEKSFILTHTMLLAIATNIPVLYDCVCAPGSRLSYALVYFIEL